MSLLSKMGAKKQPETVRNVYINDRNMNLEFPDNTVRNTKYTVYNFLIKNLMEQFSRFMNQYFLLIACLQLFKTLTPVDPITTWGPLVFILAVTAIKEAADDIGRHNADARANSRQFTVFRDGKMMKIPSSQISVGDIVQCLENDEIPADLVVLATSEPAGTCYIQTANLDGETDMKSRQAIPETASLPESQLKNFQGIIQCSAPNGHLYEFNSSLQCTMSTEALQSASSEIRKRLTEQTDTDTSLSPTSSSPSLTKSFVLPKTNETYSLSARQLLLQATFIKNTAFVYGVVVYTGNETKFGKNKRDPPTKLTKLDRMINNSTLWIFAFQLVLSLVLGIWGSVYQGDEARYFWYLEYRSDFSDWDFIIIPLRFLLLMSLMIPISLKVTLDVVKYVQALVIGRDMTMYYPETESAAIARSTALSEDLGQVEYVFSDKTGTLTENRMVLKKASIAGYAYGQEVDVMSDISIGSALSSQELMEQALTWQYDVNKEKICRASPSPTTSTEPMWIKAKTGATDGYLCDFFRVLALCNTVIPVMNAGRIEYKSSSPDEEALVKFAASYGVEFTKREPKKLSVTFRGIKEKYDLLATLEFNSVRKRMAVLVRDHRSGQVRLFIKGADETMLPRLAATQGMDKTVERSQGHLEAFAAAGLRSLILGVAEVPENLCAQFLDALHEADVSVLERDKLQDAAYELIEREVQLLGVTAIEDKLQDGVPETIKTLREANVRVWMLTGDKYATAVQIGKSCNLVANDNAHVITIRQSDVSADVHAGISRTKDDVQQALQQNKKVTLVIEGPTLQILLEKAAPDFAHLGAMAHSVICCRVTPSQKANVVAAVKNNCKVQTLAIGDGGNDVAMIQEAHVGVGIAGREGLQASRAADYSIGQFRFLKTLMLVHGRQNYRATAIIAQYCIYKSFLIAAMQAMFAFYSGMSGSSLFDSLQLSTYNIICTSLPIVLFVLDYDITGVCALKNPKVYIDSQSDRYMNVKTFIFWLLHALYQAVVIFVITIYGFGQSLYVSGSSFDLSSLSMVVFTAVMVGVTVTLVMKTKAMTVYNAVGIIGSFVFFWIFFLIWNETVWNGRLLGSFTRLHTSVTFFAMQFLVGVAILLPLLVSQAWTQFFSPAYSDVLRLVSIERKRRRKYPGMENGSANTGLLSGQVDTGESDYEDAGGLAADQTRKASASSTVELSDYNA